MDQRKSLQCQQDVIDDQLFYIHFLTENICLKKNEDEGYLSYLYVNRTFEGSEPSWTNKYTDSRYSIHLYFEGIKPLSSTYIISGAMPSKVDNQDEIQQENQNVVIDQ